jgi:hypothetical protein
MRDDTVLSSRQQGQLPITWSTFWAHIAHNVDHVVHPAGRLHPTARTTAHRCKETEIFGPEG